MARKILLADDSVTAQNMGRKILTDAGYDVVTVNNGSAALKRVAEVKPDLIVLDVYMPGYSGLEVCQRLKDAGDTSHIPVLLTVGKLEPFKPEEGRRVRADSHIVKPFEASELLTAITRLEDRMAAEPSSGSHKVTEHKADLDSGWKNRLSFSSKKKKEEQEAVPEEASTTASFRDFRKTKSGNGTNGAAILKTPVSIEPESVKVNDVPRDITPEEMDALSALASKLDGETHATEAETKNEAAATAVSTEAKETETETTPAACEPAASIVEPPAFALNVSAVDVKSELEIPVECVELAVEAPPVVAEAAVVETNGQDAPQMGTESAEASQPAIPVAMEVSTSRLVQEAAPVDRSDEPTFASFLGLVNRPAAEEAEQERVKIEENKIEEKKIEEKKTEENKTEEKKIEEKQSKPVAVSENTENTEDTIAATSQPQPNEPAPDNAPAMDAATIAESVPSDAELVEALRLLTPATGSLDLCTAPSPLAAAGQLLAEEAMRDAAATPRWVAEPMTLTPQEAAISLEAEMMSTFAVPPSVAESDAGRIVGVSAIAAAVENRLAEVDSAGIASSAPEPVAEPVSAGQHEESTPSEAAGEASTQMQVIASTTDSLNPEPSAAAESTLHAGNAMEAANTESTSEASAEEAPKAKAAAAAESSSSVTDASTIASIVDSVMADLRPKIVEEIAKKLAGK